MKVLEANNQRVANLALSCFLVLSVAACAFLFFRSDQGQQLLSTASTAVQQKNAELWRSPLGTRLGKLLTNDDVGHEEQGARMRREAHDYLQHILFNIGSSSENYVARKEIVKTWWIPNATHGYVWLDSPIIEEYSWQSLGLPEPKISEDTSALPYYSFGPRAVLRLTRIVAEAYRLEQPHIHWFVMGDDDTVFNAEALAELLSQHNHNEMLLFGAGSEMVGQMDGDSHEMPFGGAGFIISRPLARALSLRVDECIRRLAFLFGLDARIGGCVAELGVQIIKLRGLHQWDLIGNVKGLLEAYSVGPLLSMHHVLLVDPVFPGMTYIEALQRLTTSMHADPMYFLETAVCFDETRLFTLVVTWGYSVRVFEGVWNAWDLQKVERTFLPFGWDHRFDFNVRDEIFPAVNDSCALPLNFWVDEVRPGKNESTESLYSRVEIEERKACTSDIARVSRVKVIREAGHSSETSRSISTALNVHSQWQCCKSLTFDDSGLAATVVLSSCKEGS